MIQPNLIQRLLARDIIAERDRLAQALDAILQFSAALNAEINDPHADGSGTDSTPPDGDTFNALDAEVCAIAREALTRTGT
jgi:hypothetical protein